MTVQSPFPYEAGDPSAVADKIRSDLVKLKSARTTGELGTRISAVVLLYSLKDIQQMRHNFYEKIRNVTRNIAIVFTQRSQNTFWEHGIPCGSCSSRVHFLK